MPTQVIPPGRPASAQVALRRAHNNILQRQPSMARARAIVCHSSLTSTRSWDVLRRMVASNAARCAIGHFLRLFNGLCVGDERWQRTSRAGQSAQISRPERRPSRPPGHGITRLSFKRFCHDVHCLCGTAFDPVRSTHGSWRFFDCTAAVSASGLDSARAHSNAREHRSDAARWDITLGAVGCGTSADDLSCCN